MIYERKEKMTKNGDTVRGFRPTDMKCFIYHELTMKNMFKKITSLTIRNKLLKKIVLLVQNANY
jgi:hypothetical protein